MNNARLSLHRCNLASVMLQLLAMKVPNVLTFDFMSKPSPGEWTFSGVEDYK